MYNVNFSRIRGLCRLFHYYFLFICLISKEAKLLCMEPINCNANDSSRQIDTQKRSENNSALQIKSYHKYTQKRTKKRSTVSPSYSHSCIDCTFKDPYLRDSHTHAHRQTSIMCRCMCVRVLFGQSI